MNQSIVLCFNLSAYELRQVHDAAAKVGAREEPVAPADFGQTVGALIGVLERKKVCCFAPFDETMIIMCGFDKTKMETFLDDLKAAGVRIPYKAMLTPANVLWRCEDLIKELKQEHEQFQKMRENK